MTASYQAAPAGARTGRWNTGLLALAGKPASQPEQGRRHRH